jgi:hypothetical protein
MVQQLLWEARTIKASYISGPGRKTPVKISPGGLNRIMAQLRYLARGCTAKPTTQANAVTDSMKIKRTGLKTSQECCIDRVMMKEQPERPVHTTLTQCVPILEFPMCNVKSGS